ncbi:hypothetical protein JHS3_14080 [Jeongeupia sp. HS-3]|uniref:hypothetical protein n=1 Tax=Jeongeupia sp. HS-3 TaxID=1009682 RepID=UPI0018A39D12|nr:hypothetical protein [Jeongeupia sp. HS-3]BCL75672.1 hypothetical protein JHS3_14080 [Jeongeupia sp. HS-3]
MTVTELMASLPTGEAIHYADAVAVINGERAYKAALIAAQGDKDVALGILHYAASQRLHAWLNQAKPTGTAP